MLFTPEAGAPAPELVLQYMVRMALASVVIAWFYERSNRSVAVAIAIHAGAHLDNITRIPQAEVRLHILHLLALAIAALFARIPDIKILATSSLPLSTARRWSLIAGAAMTSFPELAFHTHGGVRSATIPPSRLRPRDTWRLIGGARRRRRESKSATQAIEYQ